MLKNLTATSTLGLLCLIAAGCSDSDDQGTDPADSAEETTFSVTIENISGAYFVAEAGAFNTPVNADEAGPLLPGEDYEFSFQAVPGHRLSFATMFVQSNDWYVGTESGGIALYDEDGEPLVGEISGELLLLDAGTEADETPGESENQAPRQGPPNTGDDDPNDEIREVDGRSADAYLSVVVSHDGGTEFTVTITNVSDGASIETPFAPGAFAVHHEGNPLYEVGSADTGMGLDALAEDGDPSELVESLADITGLATPLAPGAWAVHDDWMPLFVDGEADAGYGLEALAEDGMASELGDFLAESYSAAVFGDAPAFPGESYSFEVTASAGQSLSFATMLVQTNDYFIAPSDEGIELFDADGSPISGEVDVLVWDAGTEVDEPNGLGPNQAPRQSGPDTGEDEDGIVTEASLDAGQFVRVTIEPTN